MKKKAIGVPSCLPQLTAQNHPMGVGTFFSDTGGELFDHILAHRYLKERDACRLFAQLMSGVHYLHSKHIVHRDLKLVICGTLQRTCMCTSLARSKVFYFILYRKTCYWTGIEISSSPTLDLPTSSKVLLKTSCPRPVDHRVTRRPNLWSAMDFTSAVAWISGVVELSW